MRNVAVPHFSYDFRFNHYIQFTGLCAYLPVRFSENAYKNEKNISFRYVLFIWYPHRESRRLTYANCPHNTGTHLYCFPHDFL